MLQTDGYEVYNDKLKIYLQEQYTKVLPCSPIGKAIAYTFGI
ncbi:hypothetical protein QNI16_36260 [Cytophagaceae bacterium YF14B1]|uniref:Uncharacterized protein n=1 Tax=Xanthocytophaga flava TaxID=3048013 RepID=A0AAE3QV48_9BACT|nr:hypothetical protein [Xanthocytophaga flavus]